MKDSIKREQSQASLSFAERKNFRPKVKKTRLLTLLVLLAAVVTGAWAQTETLLTTITPTAKEQASYSTANVATVSFSYIGEGYSVYNANWGWWGYGFTATVTAAEGYTITKCVFYDNDGASATDSTDPFIVETEEQNKTPKVNGATFGAFTSAGIKKIEVYGYATYSVTLAEGTEDADKWSVKVGEEAAAFPVEGLEGGEKITVTYGGDRKVKSVKAVKKAGNAYLTWDADQKKLVATEIPTTYNPAENADADVNWSAGTYVVEGEVNINGNIILTGDVNLIIKDGATLTAKKINGNSSYKLSIYGQANQTGQLVVNSSSGSAIMNITTLEVHSCQVTATSSSNYLGGFNYISIFNVYGGSVDAKSTAADCGYGIWLSAGGSMNIYGGEVNAEGKGNDSDYSYGIKSSSVVNVTVYGGKLRAENADNKALDNINLTKGEGFSGTIKSSSDKLVWFDGVDADAKYVKAE